MSRIVFALLTFFVGGFGIHKFIVKKPVHGILMLLFCWTGIPSIIALIECIMYLMMDDEKFFAKFPMLREGA